MAGKTKPAAHTVWQAGLAAAVAAQIVEWVPGFGLPEWQIAAALTGIIGGAASLGKGVGIDLLGRARKSDRTGETLDAYLLKVERRWRGRRAARKQADGEPAEADTTVC